jgi:FkbM family methyltransferase
MSELLRAKLIEDFVLAVDGGAHVGAWTDRMHRHFFRVIAIEPSEAFEHLQYNAMDWGNVEVMRAALVEKPCWVESYAPAKRKTLSARRVREVEKGSVKGITLDQLGLDRCGFIKLDLEGYELPAIRGGLETIRRCKPFLMVEITGLGKRLGYSDADLRSFLDSLDYECVFERRPDYGFRVRRDR